MFSDTKAIHAYFLKLGLSSEIAEIYLALLTHGPQTVSGLARLSGVERTKLYRLMDEMAKSQLVEVEAQYKKNIFHAAPIANLQLLLTKKEQDLHDLQADLPYVRQELARAQQATPATRVQFYKGIDGLKQMLWNQTKGSTENLAILSENMQTHTNLKFFERWVETCNARGLEFRGIINDNFIATQQEWHGKYSSQRLKSWQSRYLPDTVFAITHSVVIYDNVTAYYNWKDGEIFGIELYNQEIADSQRQLFEMLWVQGLPVDDVKGLARRAV